MLFNIKKSIKNIILINLTIQLLAGFAMKQVAIAACCSNGAIDRDIDDNYSMQNYLPKYSEEDINWANKVSKSARNMGWQDLKEKFAIQEQIDNKKMGDIGDISDMHPKRPALLHE